MVSGSPVSNDGRGLKQAPGRAGLFLGQGSPVSNDGRGLKPLDLDYGVYVEKVRPSAMTGVD